MTLRRTHTLFTSLMALAFAAAFIIPTRWTVPFQGSITVLLIPVSAPSRAVAGWLSDRIWPRVRDEASPDRPRTPEQVLLENERLRAEVANLTLQLDRFRALAMERTAMGSLRDACAVFSVVGADSAGRDALLLASSVTAPPQIGMVALTPAAILGRVEHSRAGGLHVRLLSDAGMRFTCTFGRYTTGESEGSPFQALGLPATVAQGQGRGRIGILNLKWKDALDAQLKEGDIAVLDDVDWPAKIRGRPIGRVTRVEQSKRNMLFAEVTVEPLGQPMQLREMMILVKP